MPKKKTNRLSDVVPQYASEGANDIKWFLIEHQLVQIKVSAGVVIETLKDIEEQPENANERGIATDCIDITRMMFRHVLDHYATFLSYLSDTDISERISQVEV